MYARHQPTLAIVLLVLLLVMIAGPVVELVKAEAVGYLAIKDYLGTIWTLEDVQKIINTTIQTVDGELKSLADYFWIVVDNDTNNPINLRDFIASPLDNSTAVIPLPVGDHIVDIYWFGFHQRQLVNIVENTHYVLNLETAPVMPYPYSGEPPSSSYEWDLASNPDGLTISRRDGNAWIRFNYNQTYITVAWYDDDTGWNYYPLDIDINNNYGWSFHITDPANPTYTEEHTGSFLWFTWDIAKVAEEVKWNRTKQILHVVYTVVVAENQALFTAVDEFWNSVSRTVIEIASGKQFIDPITSTIHRLEDFVTFVQSAYDTWMGEFYASKYQKTIVLIWDVFCTPTQVIILAHCYDVDENGNLNPRPITSNNAFVINNRLVFTKILRGGFSYSFNGEISLNPPDDVCYISIVPSYTFASSYELKTCGVALPINHRFYVDDLSLYDYEFWFSARFSITMDLIIEFNDVAKADQFEQNLLNHGIFYTRDFNKFIINTTGNLILEDFSEVEECIPSQSSGYTQYYFEPIFSIDNPSSTINGDVHIYLHVIPKTIPPQISLLKDGYYTVFNAFAVQVYTDLYRSDNDNYMLGYYILNGEPPPSYIIRDVHYDIENDLMHYVYTIISADCYGQDIVYESGSRTHVIPQDIYILAGVASWSSGTVDTRYRIELYYDHVTIRVYKTASGINIRFRIVLNNGNTIVIYDKTSPVDDQLDIYYSNYSISIYSIKYIDALEAGTPKVRVYVDGRPYIVSADWSMRRSLENPPRYEINETIKDNIRTFNNVTLALFSFSRMSFLNLAPEIIEYLLAIPPNEGGYGTPFIDWSTVSVIILNFSRPYELYYYDKPSNSWIRVKPVFYNDTLVYDIVRYSDNVLVEKLENHDISQYYYKLIYTDTNETYKGWLWNDNGTPKMITGQVTWSLTYAELQQLLAMVQLEGIMDQWAQAWEDVARKLGLISKGLAAAASWFNTNWIWLLLGFFGVMFMIVLIFALASRPRITVAVPR